MAASPTSIVVTYNSENVCSSVEGLYEVTPNGPGEEKQYNVDSNAIFVNIFGSQELYIKYNGKYYGANIIAETSNTVELSSITPWEPPYIDEVNFGSGYIALHDKRIPGIDTTPTSGSDNLVTSGGVYSAMPAAQVNSDWNASSGVAQILNKPTIPSPKIYVGTCTTAAATAAKTATVETFPLDANNKPLVGTVVGIKFSNTNSAESATLNVNSTGAASIWYDAAAYTGSGAYAGAASRYLYFVWDGTYWAFLSWGYDKDADTNTVGYNLRINGLALPFKSKTYRYRLKFASPDNKQLVPANTATSTDATTARTVNQDKINPFGVIWYYSYTSAISAGSTTTVARLWYQYGGIVLGYSINNTGAALTMTAKDPIYLKCAPQTDGSAIMDSTTPIVHALPSTADGKIYILLGYAESETAMTLIANHPVYYYADGQIRLWTNPSATSADEALSSSEIQAIWDSAMNSNS